MVLAQGVEAVVKAIFEVIMNTNKSIQEQISAFVDGELAQAAQVSVLTALRSPAERAVWDDYHHIGDILRSVEMAAAVRFDFATRVAAHLVAEPTFNATTAEIVPTDARPAAGQARWLKSFAMSGAAVAAAVVLAIVAAPRMTGLQEVAVVKLDALALNGASGVTVLRDPRMEEYLLAHQQYSPSVFSTAQFARSATFATDSLK